MNDNRKESSENELKRNEIFLELESLLKASISSTSSLDEGNIILQRFALYGEEEIENE